MKAILDADDLQLVSAVGKASAGKKLSEITGDSRAGALVHRSVADALTATPADVLIDYTKPDAVKANVQAAIAKGCHVVIGTSGLTDTDYAEIAAWALAKGVGAFAAGNFSITAALMQHFATEAAVHMPHWEILDYASDTKPDAPSGTARELAYQLAQVVQPTWTVPVAATQGSKESRGARASTAPSCIPSGCPASILPSRRSSAARESGSNCATSPRVMRLMWPVLCWRRARSEASRASSAGWRRSWSCEPQPSF